MKFIYPSLKKSFTQKYGHILIPIHKHVISFGHIHPCKVLKLNGFWKTDISFVFASRPQNCYQNCSLSLENISVSNFCVWMEILVFTLNFDGMKSVWSSLTLPVIQTLVAIQIDLSRCRFHRHISRDAPGAPELDFERSIWISSLRGPLKWRVSFMFCFLGVIKSKWKKKGGEAGDRPSDV